VNVSLTLTNITIWFVAALCFRRWPNKDW